MPSLTRRQLLATAAGVGSVLPSEIVIHPRESWAGELVPSGPLEAEDVRFLVVHHSATSNGHTSADVPEILREFYQFHTEGRGWSDVAYNFLIDSEGAVWEGRAGSLDGAVAGDATGGNQGFSQLVCLIGNFEQAVPTQAALDSLVAVLAWLADRDGVSTTPGSEVTFTSRGSNRWPAGTEVTTPTITGHRTMSLTLCPGANLNPYVEDGLMADVEAMRVASTAFTTTAPTTTLSQSTTTTSLVPTAPSTTLPAPVGPVERAGVGGLFGVAGGMVAVGAGLLLWRHRRMR